MTTASSDSLYLDPDQQDLLLRALQSNSDSRLFTSPSVKQVTQSMKHSSQHSTPESMSSQYGNGTPPPTAALDGAFADGTPLMGGDLDYADWEKDFEADGAWDYDFDVGLNGGDSSMNGTVYEDTPGSMSQDNEKRKSPPANDDGSPSSDPHDTEPKRRESDGATAKKPGRKPLTSEPTSKRKAQNRAAQRAFRERKEKHLKDLEQKVLDLEKASESANHENSLLRSQVDKLQVELKDYRRRLHQAQKTPAGVGASGLFGTKTASTGGFQFEFPTFGGTPFGRQNSGDSVKVGPGTLLERLNAGPGGNVSSLSGDRKKKASTANSASSANDNIFSSYGLNNDNNGNSSSIQNTPRLNGGQDFTSSPSESSISQHGPGSSCGTSPEPMNLHGSNDQRSNTGEDGTVSIAPNGDRYICKSGPLDGETETTFCEKLGMACGSPHNPIPKAVQLNTPTQNSLDWLTQQNGGTFDPVLFNDYRDPINEINAGINMSFFEDAFPMTTSFADIESPFAGTGLAGVDVGKKNVVAEADRAGDDDDDEEEEVVPADDPKKMLSCNKIWDCINAHPSFANGELDMDILCSELRNKAKCSETGVVVAESDVRDVLTMAGVQPIDFH